MIAAVSSSSTQAIAPPTKAPDAAQVFKQLDADNKGYLSASDLASAVVNISPQGAQRSTDDAQAQAAADFTRMDSDSDGQVTLDEFKAAAPPADSQAGASRQASGGARPAAGPGHGGAPAGGASASQSYEPEDTNQDGTVSEQERQAYAAKHPTTKPESSDTPTADKPATASRSASAAVATYETVANAA